MAKTKAYTNYNNSGRMLINSKLYLFILVNFITILLSVNCFAQKEPEYDEISVFINVPKLGGTEIDAVIKGGEVFLPVTELFNFLKIKNSASRGMDTISGFFINQEATYLIDRINNSINYGKDLYKLKPGDLVRTETNLYLRGLYFGKIFGLDCKFDFRALTVTIDTKLELPVIREMRLAEMRQNMSRLKGEVKADTSIGRRYPLFHFGMADWSVISSEPINEQSDTRVSLALGAIIAGGETTASLYYSSRDPVSEKQQYYLWRYVNNDNTYIRQVMAGKIATYATSTIYNPVIGVQVTNTPTTFRRSFGSYTLSDKTEPGWIVELYVNNILIDYVKADASGFYKFEVPLVYGNSLVKLKFYGPWGEERTSERNISIPFNFIPKNTLEYTVSGGLVEDTLLSRFSRTSVNYGLTRGITIGGGLEYLSSVSSGPFMPYVNTSIRLASNLLFSGEYAYSVRARGTLTYRLTSGIQIDLDYTKYARDQKAINFNYLEDRKAVLTIPIPFKKLSMYNRFTVDQLVLPTTRYIMGEWLLSGSALGVNTNITTYSLFVGEGKPYIYSNLSVSFRLPSNLTVIPQAQYGFTDNEILSAKVSLEKRLFQKGFLNLSYEQNFRNNLRMGELGFRYDFKFAQTGFSARQSNKLTTLVQYARGSFINDRQTEYLGTDNRPNVGRGGISIIAFIDQNGNGKRDPGEPKAYGLNLHSSGGRVERSERDTIIRILGLEPYANCFIELDPSGFENIAWRLPKRVFSVAVDPNMLKLIEVPIIVVGEASGKVSIEREGKTNGIARMIVNICTKDQKPVARMLSEEDGYFSYLGLNPGEYNVRIDTVQLRRLGMKSIPDSIDFKIIPSLSGDFVKGLDFTVHMIEEVVPVDTTRHTEIEKPELRRDTTIMIVHEISQEIITIAEDSWAIQLGAFRIKSNAEVLRSKLEKILGTKVEIIVEDNYYKVRINEIKERQTVDEYLDVLQRNGVTEVWVIKLKAKQKQVILQKQDTIRRITETIVQRPSPPVSAEMLMQAGIFRLKSNAIALRSRLPVGLREKVIILEENGYYKLRIMGLPILRQYVIEEMKKVMPTVGKFGLEDIWVLPVLKVPVEEPVVVRTETTPTPVSWRKEVTGLVHPEKYNRLIEVKIEIPAIPPEPAISIIVGEFYKKSEANKAMRLITKKLKLPVEILPQYDYYLVIIPGFFTRQETYRYFPELAGLGYPGVSISEKKKK